MTTFSRIPDLSSRRVRGSTRHTMRTRVWHNCRWPNTWRSGLNGKSGSRSLRTSHRRSNQRRLRSGSGTSSPRRSGRPLRRHWRMSLPHPRSPDRLPFQPNLRHLPWQSNHRTRRPFRPYPHCSRLCRHHSPRHRCSHRLPRRQRLRGLPEGGSRSSDARDTASAEWNLPNMWFSSSS
jgi:hypothetical protein